MRRISDRIEADARRIVDDIATKGQVDFVAEVSALVPMHNICDMVGIPSATGGRWPTRPSSRGLARSRTCCRVRIPMTRLFEAVVTMRTISAELIAERRENPQDDLLTSLVEAEVEGERLTDDEIISFLGLLMIAGNDTTRQSTSHGMKALTDHPEQRAWLLEDLPGRMPMAVEEIVRWATPIMTFRRTASRDCGWVVSRSRPGTRW